MYTKKWIYVNIYINIHSSLSLSLSVSPKFCGEFDASERQYR